MLKKIGTKGRDDSWIMSEAVNYITRRKDGTIKIGIGDQEVVIKNAPLSEVVQLIENPDIIEMHPDLFVNSSNIILIHSDKGFDPYEPGKYPTAILFENDKEGIAVPRQPSEVADTINESLRRKELSGGGGGGGKSRASRP